MFSKKNKPLILFRNPGLYLEEVQDKGRGVFCLQDIKEGETVEVAPVMIFPTKESPNIHETMLTNYVFSAASFPEKFLKSINIDIPKDTCCLPLGITSLCNHMVDPNTKYSFSVDDLYPYATLTALRDIPKGEELSVSYGDVWFARRKMRLVKRP
ncbi:MAG: SET domain-containing protein-lysine N-methyltransferase [Alphaproteobacteria bacterium]